MKTLRTRSTRLWIAAGYVSFGSALAFFLVLAFSVFYMVVFPNR